MGLCIALQSESGEQLEFIADEKNLLDRLLGYPDRLEFPMLASIDRYGDTTFNRMQIEPFLAEWETLFDKAATPEERFLLEAIKKLMMFISMSSSSAIKIAYSFFSANAVSAS